MSTSIENTIEVLRQCNQAQSEVILNLELYERAVTGSIDTVPETPGGYANGYAAQLEYLTFRKNALETLIASVERYGRMAGAEPGAILIDKFTRRDDS